MGVKLWAPHTSELQGLQPSPSSCVVDVPRPAACVTSGTLRLRGEGLDLDPLLSLGAFFCFFQFSLVGCGEGASLVLKHPTSAGLWDAQISGAGPGQGLTLFRV